MFDQKCRLHLGAGLGVLKRPLESTLESRAVDRVDKVDFSQVLLRRKEGLLVSPNVSIRWTVIGRIDVDVDWQVMIPQSATCLLFCIYHSIIYATHMKSG